MANFPELAALLAYQNKAVVTYFCDHRPDLSLPEAEELFSDLLSWLWLNAQRTKLGKKTYLFGPLLPLDELWHTFILHTRDYVDFSICYFGAYVHHDIEPGGFEHRIEEDELRDYLHDCFTYLGAEWVARRFDIALA